MTMIMHHRAAALTFTSSCSKQADNSGEPPFPFAFLPPIFAPEAIPTRAAHLERPCSTGSATFSTC
jgi:hypothetical protein